MAKPGGVLKTRRVCSGTTRHFMLYKALEGCNYKDLNDSWCY